MDLTTDRFVGDVNPNLICPICIGVLKDPVQDENEHTFCRGCIYKWMENHYTCPIDRAYLHRYKLKPAPRLLKNFLSELQISCDYKDNGCEEILRLDTLCSHLRVCEFQPEKTIECPFGCEIILQRNELNAHSCIRELKNENKQLVSAIEQLKNDFKHLSNLIEQNQAVKTQQPTTIDESTSTNNCHFFLFTFLFTLAGLMVVYMKIFNNFSFYGLICTLFAMLCAYVFTCYKTQTSVMFLWNCIFSYLNK